MEEVKYSIAVRRKQNRSEFFWNISKFIFRDCQLDDLGLYWYADPFIFERNNTIYLFFEAFDRVEKKGKIGYSYLTPEGKWSTPRIIIDEKFHLSFPNVFEEDDIIYMMPESCADNTVKLYKAVVFPDVWEAADSILPDSFSCDSVFIDTCSSRYLLTNELYRNVPGNGSQGCYVKLFIYKLNRFKTIDYGQRIKDGDDGIRNAGKIIYQDNKYYRIGQDCRNREYGRGLVLFEIDSLEPYREHEVNRFDRDYFESHIDRVGTTKLRGVHTYNSNDKFEVIDFYVNDQPSKQILLKRKITRIWSFLRRHINMR